MPMAGRLVTESHVERQPHVEVLDRVTVEAVPFEPAVESLNEAVEKHLLVIILPGSAGASGDHDAD